MRDITPDFIRVSSPTPALRARMAFLEDFGEVFFAVVDVLGGNIGRAVPQYQANQPDIRAVFRLEVQTAAWLVIQQEPASIQLVGLPEKVLRAGETGAMLDVIREIYRLEEVVIKNNKKPEKYSGFLYFITQSS